MGYVLIDMKKKEKFIMQCCVCKKVRHYEGFEFPDRTHMVKWDYHKKDLEEIHDEFDVLYSHGYCNSCAENQLKELYMVSSDSSSCSY